MDFKDLCDFLTFQQSKKSSMFFSRTWCYNFGAPEMFISQEILWNRLWNLRVFPTVPWDVLILGGAVEFPTSRGSKLRGLPSLQPSDKSVVPRPMQFHSIAPHCLGFFQMRFFFVKGKKLPKNKREQDATILPSSFLQFALTFPKDLPWPLFFQRFFTRIAQSPRPPLFFVTVIRKSSTGEAIRLQTSQHPSQSAPSSESFPSPTSWPDKSKYQPRNDHRFFFRT